MTGSRLPVGALLSEGHSVQEHSTRANPSLNRLEPPSSDIGRPGEASDRVWHRTLLLQMSLKLNSSFRATATQPENHLSLSSESRLVPDGSRAPTSAFLASPVSFQEGSVGYRSRLHNVDAAELRRHPQYVLSCQW